jgi:hypothetical protein
MFTNKQSTYLFNSITLNKAKNTVKELLKILVNLEIIIKKASIAFYVRRADRIFNKRKHYYTKLSEHL